MKRITFAILLLLTFTASLFAGVNVTLEAPRQVRAGQRFSIKYIINTQDVEDYTKPQFEGLDVLYGPSVSRASQMSFVNGHTSQSSTLTLTYTVMAAQEGTFTIPAMTVVSGGAKYSSQKGSIKVFPDNSNNAPIPSTPQSNQQGTQSHYQSQPSTSSTPAGRGNELFVVASASKKTVHEQEAILLTYKLYALNPSNLKSIDCESPKLDGFHIEELPLGRNITFDYEQYNDRLYGSAVCKQYVIYPQKSGKMSIPSITFDVEVVETKQRSFDPTSMDDMLDAFFNGGSLTQLVRKQLTTRPVELNVLSFGADKPASFSGAVGNYTISSTLSPKAVDANDQATLRIEISGSGNMSLLTKPEPLFPDEFEVYPRDPEYKTKLTSRGQEGSVVYEFDIVPRAEGDYTIPALDFSFFDLTTKSYKTLSTEPLTLKVNRGKGFHAPNTAKQEDVRFNANDIKDAKRKANFSEPAKSQFFGSTSYLLGYLISSLLALLAIVTLNRYASAKANVVGQRRRKASKAATRRLKTASKLLKTSQTGPFYDEVMKALTGYAADKLNIPTSDLNKDNMRELLLQAGVDEASVQRYLDAVTEAEFARFAPGDPSETKEKLYDDAIAAIDALEDSIR